MDTLALEKARIAQIIAQGTTATHCAACGQMARKWKFRFHSNLARHLIILVKLFEASNDYVHVKEIENKENYCISLARKWDLVEAEPGKVGVRGTGRWKPTQKGIDFVKNRITIPSHVFFFDDQVFGFTTKFVTIIEALGKKFDYAELLSS